MFWTGNRRRQEGARPPLRRHRSRGIWRRAGGGSGPGSPGTRQPQGPVPPLRGVDLGTGPPGQTEGPCPRRVCASGELRRRRKRSCWSGEGEEGGRETRAHRYRNVDFFPARLIAEITSTWSASDKNPLGCPVPSSSVLRADGVWCWQFAVRPPPRAAPETPGAAVRPSVRPSPAVCPALPVPAAPTRLQTSIGEADTSPKPSWLRGPCQDPGGIARPCVGGSGRCRGQSRGRCQDAASRRVTGGGLRCPRVPPVAMHG